MKGIIEKEVILEIKEDEFRVARGKDWQGQMRYDTYEGYVITTNNQIVKVGVSNEQSCCEEWGYLTTNDDLKEFVGATLLDITITDTALNTEALKTRNGYEVSNCMFVNFETNRGKMQLVAYNEHNGYYGHDAVVISDQLAHSVRL